MQSRARHLANAALVSGALLAILGPLVARYAMLHMLADYAGPSLWQLPLWMLVLGTPEGLVIQPDPSAPGSILLPGGPTPLITLDPIWVDGAPPLVAGLGQVVAGLIARRLSEKNARRAMAVLIGGSLLGLVVAWPLTPSRALTMWLGWACPAVVVSAVLWGLGTWWQRRRSP